MTKKEYLLSCLVEECAEVQQATVKALRFGLESGNPNSENFSTNADDIVRELTDLLAIIEMLEDEEIIEKSISVENIDIKKEKVKKYMEISKRCGTLDA